MSAKKGQKFKHYPKSLKTEQERELRRLIIEIDIPRRIYGSKSDAKLRKRLMFIAVSFFIALRNRIGDLHSQKRLHFAQYTIPGYTK